MVPHRGTIPEPSLKRLPDYVHVLRVLKARGAEHVSTTDISSILRLDPTQVRKDLAWAGAAGRPRTGYRTCELVQTLEDFLGWHSVAEAFLVGAGNLGSALIGYQGMREHGLYLVAAFDKDPAKIGTTIQGLKVQDVDRLASEARRMQVRIGVLTVPGGAAQEVAEKMVLGGILAIWNLTPVSLQLPTDVFVQDGGLYAQIAVLLRRAEEGVARKLGSYHHKYSHVRRL